MLLFEVQTAAAAILHFCQWEHEAYTQLKKEATRQSCLKE